MLVSVLSLTLVCGERLALVTGKKLAVNTSRIPASTVVSVTACCLVWLLAAFVACPLIFYRFFVQDRLWVDYEESFCAEERWVTKEYMPSVVVGLIWLPMIFLVIAYMIIFCKLDQHEASVRGREHPLAQRRRRRLLSLMFVVLLVYLVCYAPFTIFLIVRAFTVHSSEDVDDYFNLLWWLSHWLAYLNSALNPLIYGFTNKSFARAWRSSCPVCVFSRPAADDDHSPRPSHAHQHHPHIYQFDSCYSNRPRTPLAVEALRGSGPQSERGHGRRTSIIHGRRASPASLLENTSPTPARLSTLDEVLAQESGNNEPKQKIHRKATRTEHEVFTTETSKFPLTYIENESFCELIENGQFCTL
ncbi:hypothetical protein OTU49_008476 [Cherax quadricarinatus]|uniref:G-protein coupled receptors family 1 profile domain-containing protein n=1 Tax=Cherax quadricarinatus TaxID=27406 RepID=A0AAW0WD14_CHEQU